tara:strand:+ start:285 stop:485 length:201 start_codon:yes stop_codon:yes gene_type:complete
MNCWHCKTELIWGGDHDEEEDSEYSISTNLSCPKCNALVIVYLPKEEHWSESLPETDITIEDKETP